MRGLLNLKRADKYYAMMFLYALILGLVCYICPCFFLQIARLYKHKTYSPLPSPSLFPSLHSLLHLAQASSPPTNAAACTCTRTMGWCAMSSSFNT